MTVKQKTLARSVTLSGTGLHTGVQVDAVFSPADEHTGILFERNDLPGKPVVRASAEFVTDTARNTVLEDKGARVGQVEHALSALAGLEVDNVLISVNGPEMPILDGSARQYVQAFLTAGVVAQDADREVDRPARVFRGRVSPLEDEARAVVPLQVVHRGACRFAERLGTCPAGLGIGEEMNAAHGTTKNLGADEVRQQGAPERRKK